MNDQLNTPASLQAMYEELARLVIERDGLMKLMREATAEADLEQMAVLLPGLTTVRLDIEEVEASIKGFWRRQEMARREQERLAELVQLPRPRLFAPVLNAYGSPFVFEADGRKYFAISCEALGECVEVSQAFYDAFNSEFDGKAYDTAPGFSLLMDSRDDNGTTFILHVPRVEAK